MSNDVLTVGDEQDAAQLALTLRQLGSQGSVMFVGDEPYPP